MSRPALNPAAAESEIAAQRYAALCNRVSRRINAPLAQRDKAAALDRLPEESEDDWNRVLDEIDENENVTIAQRDGTHARIFWTVPKEA